MTKLVYNPYTKRKILPQSLKAYKEKYGIKACKSNEIRDPKTLKCVLKNMFNPNYLKISNNMYLKKIKKRKTLISILSETFGKSGDTWRLDENIDRNLHKIHSYVSPNKDYQEELLDIDLRTNSPIYLTTIIERCFQNIKDVLNARKYNENVNTIFFQHYINSVTVLTFLRKRFPNDNRIAAFLIYQDFINRKLPIASEVYSPKKVTAINKTKFNHMNNLPLNIQKRVINIAKNNGKKRILKKLNQIYQDRQRRDSFIKKAKAVKLGKNEIQNFWISEKRNMKHSETLRKQPEGFKILIEEIQEVF